MPALTGRQKLVLVLFAGSFLVMIYGFIPWNDLWQEGWGTDFPLPTFGSFYFPEAAALFFVMAVVDRADRQARRGGHGQHDHRAARPTSSARR